MARSAHSYRSAVVLVPALLLAACGTAPSAPTPSAGTRAATPEQVLSLGAPRLEVPVPQGWARDSLGALRASIANQAQDTVDPNSEILADLVSRIDRHIIRGSFTAPSGDNIVVSVETGDESLTHAADRRTAYLMDTGSSQNVWTVASRTQVVLPIGPAIRIVARQDPAPGLISRSIEYVVLDDGATVSVEGTAPWRDQSLAPVMATLAGGLRTS